MDTSIPHLGEISALAAAFFWSFTAVFFSEAGRIIGSYRVNKIRLVFAVVIYMIVLTITTGHPIPTGLNILQIFWLSLSGLIGLVIGDSAGFKALVMIGPRLTTLLFCTVPIITTLVAWVFLGEKLQVVDIVGIAITIGGVAWVVLERGYQSSNRFDLHDDHPDRGTLTRGIVLVSIASVGQALGLVLSKQGMIHAGPPVDPMQASFVRMASAVIIIWGWALIRGEARGAFEAARHGKAMFFTFGGAVFGPFLGVWSSLVALAHTSAGIAATLNSTSPILILPTVILYYKEHVSPRAAIGAAIAVIGVTLLFLGDEIFGL
jgi:drug/metabolite transporter (DMT)-like permease